jgi:hypothetical protein
MMLALAQFDISTMTFGTVMAVLGTALGFGVLLSGCMFLPMGGWAAIGRFAPLSCFYPL